MRIVLQRVTRASVKVEGRVVGEIGGGLLLLVGIHQNDNEAMASALAEKCAELRIFADEDGKMNRSIKEIGGAALVISQFTLYGDCRKGRRPNFMAAALPPRAKELYDFFVERMRGQVASVETGIFGAMMEVELVNDGPVTLVIEKEGGELGENAD